VDFLESYFSFVGSLVLLIAVSSCGLALVVQSTLGNVLAAWRDRLRQLWQSYTLARERRKERREKERARRRVITKHLQRVVEEKQRKEEETPHIPHVARVPSKRMMQLVQPVQPLEAPSEPSDRIDLPMRPAMARTSRITERRGEADFGVRRVSASELREDDEFHAVREAVRAAAEAPPIQPAPTGAPRKKAGPQPPLPFVAEIAPGTLPPVNLLQMGEGRSAMDEAELVRLGELIRSRCAEFGVEGSVEAISPGPVITVFEFQPAPGVKVSQIVNLQDDLALALRAEAVRIDRMPGRSTLGIEVPNRERAVIRLGSLLADERFKKSPSVLTMALGTDINGEPYYADLATMPHLLVAGATGAGKSVGLQSMITSILYKATRDEVQFIFIDPKRIELGVYADIPHLKCEVVVDPKKAANALRWAVAEMERRYRLLAEVHVRSIAYYNRAIQDPSVQERLSLSEGGESAFTAADLKPLPYYVVVIDELADLMMVSSSDVETSIARLAQMARAVGIHLIVATQRPSVDVLTGTIKANFPCRISFATASRHDSRTILDQVGSEKLLGKGDMLMMPPGSSRIMRLHGAYISEQETAGLIRWLKKQGKPELDPDVLRASEGEGGNAGDGGDNDDDLYETAAKLVVTERQASASFLQRRMRVGFSRAARLIDMMERDGLLGPAQGSKPREVLVRPDYFQEIDDVRGAVEE
ncbi:MAG TPA: DNA translocase FtsK, partial [Thermoanaerobaculia bacterium]|nr:DNA translocase FtsK [Thermoanaerobaculia bacterium]